MRLEVHMYRIESHHRSVNEDVRAGKDVRVNGVRFTAPPDASGRVLSDPIPQSSLGMFAAVSGYALVEAEAPYAVLKALDPAVPMQLNTEGKPATSEGDPGADIAPVGGLEAHVTGGTEPDAEDAPSDPPPAEIEDEGAPAEGDGYDDLTKDQLLALLKERGMEPSARTNKGDLVGLLRELDTPIVD